MFTKIKGSLSSPLVSEPKEVVVSASRNTDYGRQRRDFLDSSQPCTVRAGGEETDLEISQSRTTGRVEEKNKGCNM